MLSSLPPSDPQGFELRGPGPQVLLFHGLTGSPYDLKPLALKLNNYGCRVLVPLLKGHGGHISDLSRVKAEDWLNEGLKAVEKLEPERPIFLGGLSMGALLALAISNKTNNIKGLILLAPAMRLAMTAELLIVLANLDFIPPEKNFPKSSGGSDIADLEAKAKCPSYKEMSINGLKQFDQIRMLAWSELPRLHCPTFLAFGKYDAAIDVTGSQEIINRRLNGPIKEKIYGQSKHIVSLDFDRDELANDVWQFLKAQV